MLSEYILSAIATLIILTIHEVSHGFAAYRLGDPTAKNKGRLTLNPLRHLDPAGAICMVLFHFGWAKPVPINPGYFKHPKRDVALTALAGPLSNLLMAFFSGGLLLFFYASVRDITFTNEAAYNLASGFLTFCDIFFMSNLGLALFNLIPVPPLDGSRVLTAFLPDKAYYAIMRREDVIYWCLIAWLFAGSIVSNYLLKIPGLSEIGAIRLLAKVLSLSDLLSDAIRAVSDLILSVWQKIPALAL